jgi:alkanesulfonate monooxygenase SsuD/methylene tetrahydromethanopterin reductase-like flavin-dependent oxidoreductase (luciferase family)
VLSLTWAAGVTKRERLGTTVLVLPMRHPLPLAKELATLHNFSEGRLILGAGSGWLKEEFAALGVPFEERGRRLDEGIAMMRAVWSEDPVTFKSRYIPSVVDDDPDADQPDSALVRRKRRTRVEADDPDRGTDGTAAGSRPTRRHRS